MQTWALAAAGVLAVGLAIAAAKAHGRQVRLERERHGVWKVDFRGANDPWVEALWRRDRNLFWVLVTVFLAATLAYGSLYAGRHAAAWIGLGVAWSVAAAFTALGLASSVRLARAMRGGTPSKEWRRDALRGSLFWWAVVAGLAGASAAVLAVGA